MKRDKWRLPAWMKQYKKYLDDRAGACRIRGLYLSFPKGTSAWKADRISEQVWLLDKLHIGGLLKEDGNEIHYPKPTPR